MHTLALTSLALALLASALPARHMARSNTCPADSVLDASNFTLLALNVADSTVARTLTLSATNNATSVLAVRYSSFRTHFTSIDFQLFDRLSIRHRPLQPPRSTSQ